MAAHKHTAPVGAQSQSAIRTALYGMEEVSGILLTVHRALSDDAAEERQTLTVADRRLTEVHDALERAERTGTPAQAQVDAEPVAVSASGKGASPVTPQELETAALRVAQAVSTLDILISGGGDGDMATMCNALGLVMDYLDDCAKNLSELHRRHALTEEAQS